MNQVHPPVAIITGAGSGIGQAAARLLAANGFALALAGRRREALQETARHIAQPGSAPEPLVIAADLADEAAASTIVTETQRRCGRIDLLVNNAAIVVAQPIEHTNTHQLDSIFATNFFGPARLVAGVWPLFVAQRHGCVINISSMASVDPFPGLSMYAASKAAVESLTRSIVVEGRAHNIRAFSIAPGAVETAMLRSVVSERDLPRDRTLDPEHVAGVIVECAFGKRDAEIGRTIYLPAG